MNWFSTSPKLLNVNHRAQHPPHPDPNFSERCNYMKIIFSCSGAFIVDYDSDCQKLAWTYFFLLVTFIIFKFSMALTKIGVPLPPVCILALIPLVRVCQIWLLGWQTIEPFSSLASRPCHPRVSQSSRRFKGRSAERKHGRLYHSGSRIFLLILCFQNNL